MVGVIQGKSLLGAVGGMIFKPPGQLIGNSLDLLHLTSTLFFRRFVTIARNLTLSWMQQRAQSSARKGQKSGLRGEA